MFCISFCTSAGFDSNSIKSLISIRVLNGFYSTSFFALFVTVNFVYPPVIFILEFDVTPPFGTDLLDDFSGL
jgi:hypothetical protein